MKPDHPKEFLELSHEIGTNPHLVQGPGGNTSYKSDGTLWVKASGTCLSASLADDIFIPVHLSLAVEEIYGAGDGSCRRAVVDPQCKYRPSIETTFHAALPHKWVFHYHSIRSICHSATIEGRDALRDKLSGLAWAPVPYCHPGLTLTRRILERVGQQPDANVLILENHGLIVSGNCIAEIHEMISDIERRLDLPVAQPREPFHSQPEVDGWELCPAYASLAVDWRMRERVCEGSYYPDHVVFLGAGMQTAAVDELVQSTYRDRFPLPVVLVPDVGVYVRPDAPGAALDMLGCIYDVLARIPSEWTLVPIGSKAEAMLLDWDAEKHRQALAKRD